MAEPLPNDDPLGEVPTGAICKCGATETAVGNRTRCRQGHPLPGYAGPAFKDGAWTLARGRGEAGLPPAVVQTVHDFREQVIADQGGADQLSAVQLGYIRRLSDLEAIVRLLSNDLSTKGLLTPKGRVRSTHTRLLQSIDRWDRIAQRVGLGRTPKTLDFRQRLAVALAAEAHEVEDP